MVISDFDGLLNSVAYLRFFREVDNLLLEPDRCEAVIT